LVAIPQKLRNNHQWQQIVAIENVQRKFTKRLPGFANYSDSERLSLLNLPSLELRRLATDLIWFYRLIFGLVDISFYSPFEFRSELFCHKRHPYCQASLFLHCKVVIYSERVTAICNTLPSDVVDFYPPSLVRAKGEVFVLLYVCLFGQRFLSNPRADSRHISHAGVVWVGTCLLPFWGLAVPGGRKKRQMKFSLLWSQWGIFLHFGGF